MPTNDMKSGTREREKEQKIEAKPATVNLRCNFCVSAVAPMGKLSIRLWFQRTRGKLKEKWCIGTNINEYVVSNAKDLNN